MGWIAILKKKMTRLGLEPSILSSDYLLNTSAYIWRKMPYTLVHEVSW